MAVIRSRRASVKVERIYALVTQDAAGREGVIRFNRHDPEGALVFSLPLITDDVRLVGKLRTLATDAGHQGPMTVATFERVEMRG